jgi:hypothetical protein
MYIAGGVRFLPGQFVGVEVAKTNIFEREKAKQDSEGTYYIGMLGPAACTRILRRAKHEATWFPGWT